MRPTRRAPPYIAKISLDSVRTVRSKREDSTGRERVPLDPEPCGSDRVDVRERADTRAHLVGDRVVEREDHERFAPRVETPDLHRRDVHVVLAEERPHATDEAGLVLVLRQEEMALHRDIDPEPVDEHDPGVTL